MSSISAEDREAFAQSDLPFRMDCIDYSRCSESFKKLIDEEVQILSHPLPVFNPSYIKHLPDPLGLGAARSIISYSNICHNNANLEE